MAASCLVAFPAAARANATANADNYVTANGTLIVAAPGVLANDTTTIVNGTLQAALVTSPAHGTLILNADGSFSYFASVGFAGADTFTYRASDGSARTSTATVTITTGVRATDDSYSTDGVTPLTVAAPGVLANDKAGPGTLTATLLTPPTQGTLSLNADGSFTYVPGASFGTDPLHGFVGSDSFTYTATSSGGGSATATVTIENGFATVHTFRVSPIDPNTFPESLLPAGGLVRAQDGTFYGTTNGDGGLDGGNIFRIESDNSLTILKPFTIPAGFGQPGDTGVYPGDPGSYLTGLMRASDGNLYGTTESGGDYNQGSIYKLTFTPGSTTPTFQTLHSFNCGAGEGLDPWGVLVEGPDGALYGTNGLDNAFPGTQCWGSIVFKINKDGTGFTRLGSFDDPLVGFYQLGPVVVGQDGTVYGTSKFSAGGGTIFKLPPGVTHPIVLHTFDPSKGNGAVPSSGLVRGIDNAMYGTAEFTNIDAGGNTTDGGTIFRVTEDGQFDTLYTFDPTTGGQFEPEPPLRRGGDGRLYGETISGGANGVGGLFEFDLPAIYGGPVGGATGVFVPLHDFNPNTDGVFSLGVLGVGGDRHIYGANSGGGPDGAGVVFGPLDVIVANNAPVANVSYTAPDPSTGGTTPAPSPIEASGPSGAVVTLSSVGSSDEDDDPLSFAWAQTGGSNFSASTTSQQPGGLNFSTATGTFPIGRSTVTLTVDDNQPHPNLAPIADHRSLTVNIVVRDTLPPTVTVSATGLGATVEATGPSGATATYAASAVDLVDGSTAVTCAPASGAVFPIGTTTVTCTSFDSSNNLGTGALQITVRDTTPPTLSNVPANISVIGAPTATGAVVTYTPPTARDAVDGVTTVTCAPPSGSTFPRGQTTVSCTSTDAHGNTGRATFTVTVVADHPPVASNATVTTNLGVAIAIPLTASDADGQALTFRVATPPAHGTVSIAGNVATYTPAAGQSGGDVFTFVANDGVADSNVATVTITVLAHTTPSCSAATASPSSLWPPNHQLVPIAITGVTNADGSAATIAVTSIFQDEPTNGLGDGDTPIDGFGMGTATAIVRSERSGTGNGRVYHIRFTATANGLSCTGDVTVGVPHDQGRGRVAVDDGPQYDSTKAPPTAADDRAATLSGVATTISVLANDSDPLGLPLTIVSATNGAHGTVVVNANGTVTYKPLSGFVGTDSFTYVVRDLTGNTDSGTVTVTVSAHSDNDGCDHERHRNGHYPGDGCDHEHHR